MSKVQFIRVTNKLAKLARSGGGITVSTAVKRANAALDGVKDASIAIIDEHLAEIERAYGAGNPNRADLSLDELYDRAAKIIDAGAGLPGSGLVECARAVCELVTRSRAHHTCDWDAVEVHVSTLKVLRAQGRNLSASQRKLLLKGLSDVTDKRAGEG
ncbi:MAG: hypothetical protein ACKOD3_05855 [Phenylobacterium sp.]